MSKKILKISIIILLSIFCINIIKNSTYAKYYITETLKAIDINIVLQNEEYEDNEIAVQ